MKCLSDKEIKKKGKLLSFDVPLDFTQAEDDINDCFFESLPFYLGDPETLIMKTN